MAHTCSRLVAGHRGPLVQSAALSFGSVLGYLSMKWHRKATLKRGVYTEWAIQAQVRVRSHTWTVIGDHGVETNPTEIWIANHRSTEIHKVNTKSSESG